MTTIVRVKRRLEDNPQDALVITCKKIKIDADVSPSVYVFRGTVENQETTHLKSLVPRSDVKQQAIVNVKDIVDKLRKEHKEISTRSRYEVVNFSRGLKDEDNAGKVGLYNLVDLEKSEDIDEEVQYAYDLYTTVKQDSDIAMLNSFKRSYSIVTDLDLKYEDTSSSSEELDDVDDSNDESNWRNEYPDSDANSIDTEDMISAMKRTDLEDLSSDEDEEKICDFYSNNNEENTNLYGAAYAKYKRRILTENSDFAESNSLVHCTRAEDARKESIEGYKSDSDDGFYYGQDDDNDQSRDHYSDSSDAYSPD